MIASPVMPNVLAHFGVQGGLTRSIWRYADPRWIYLGCIIPDLPWILRKATRVVAPASVNAYDHWLYAHIQSSLFFSLILCACFALFSAAPRRVFLILGLNALLHLLLDALQTKWGNGVNLLAPISWDLWNVGLFWIDSLVTYLLTLLGLGVIAWELVRRRGVPTPLCFRPLALLALALWVVGPLLFLDAAEEGAGHPIRTLRRVAFRTGKEIELDRQSYVYAKTGDRLRIFSGEVFLVQTSVLCHDATVSIRAVFESPMVLRIIEIRDHSGFNRDLPSYLGLFLLAVLWLRRAPADGRGTPPPPPKADDSASRSPPASG